MPLVLLGLQVIKYHMCSILHVTLNPPKSSMCFMSTVTPATAAVPSVYRVSSALCPAKVVLGGLEGKTTTLQFGLKGKYYHSLERKDLYNLNNFAIYLGMCYIHVFTCIQLSTLGCIELQKHKASDLSWTYILIFTKCSISNHCSTKQTYN